MTPHSFYLAGPMTGIPQFNFPAFDAAAAELRDQGYEITSPAELDDTATREAALASPDGAPGSGSANDESYGTFLSRDVKLIIDDVDGVVTLPDFEKSRGARIEVFTALTMGKPAYRYHKDEGTITEWTPWVLASALTPGDPGNGSQHQTPAEAAGPPFEATREPGHIHEELRAQRTAIPQLDEIKRSLDMERVDGREPVDVTLPTPITPKPWPTTVFGLKILWDPTMPKGMFRLSDTPAAIPEGLAEASGGALPAGEERITSETGGQKGAKLCAIGDLDPEALMAVGEVAGFGAKKYARLNYTKGFDWSLAFNALMRHALLFWSGEDYDDESELPHMAHAAWQCLCLLSFAQHLRGRDDRHINFYMEGKAREFEAGS